MPVIKKLSVQKNNESLPTEYDIGANVENIDQDENTSLKNKVNSKQDILIAGENIVIGADGKTISATGGGSGGTTVIANPAGEPTDELSTVLIGDTIYDVVSGEELESAVETLQENFQDGVDSIYDACVSKGSTPASHSLADVVDAIDNIGGGEGFFPIFYLPPFGTQCKCTKLSENTGQYYLYTTFYSTRYDVGAITDGNIDSITNANYSLLASIGYPDPLTSPCFHSKVYLIEKQNTASLSEIQLVSDCDAAGLLAFNDEPTFGSPVYNNNVTTGDSPMTINFNTPYCLFFIGYRLEDQTYYKGGLSRFISCNKNNQLCNQIDYTQRPDTGYLGIQIFCIKNDGTNTAEVTIKFDEFEGQSNIQLIVSCYIPMTI